MPSVDPIKYEEDRNFSAIEIQRRLVGLLNDIQDEEESINVYIDYTGGMRDTSFLITILTRYLEFRNIQCKAIVYSDYNEKKIVDITYIYEMFKVLNGVNEFVLFANASTLENVYSSVNDVAAKEVIGGIISFSKSMSLCRVGELDRSIDKITKGMKLAKKQSKRGGDIYSEMFTSLIPLIREKMGIELNDDGERYINLIRWCVENGLIQQATTLFVEKVPKYFFEKKIIPSKIIKVAEKGNYDTPQELFYSGVFDEIGKDKRLHKFMNIVRKASSIVEADQLDDKEKQSAEILKTLRSRINQNKDVAAGIRRTISLIEYLDMNSEAEVGYTNNFKFHKDTSDAGSVCKRIYENWKLAHFLLYKDIRSFNSIPSGKENTYKRKILAINKLEQGEYEGISKKEREQLISIMQYFFAIKVLRNRMNHASEDLYTEDEKRALRYLKEKGIFKKDDYDSVKGLIISAVDNAANL